MNIPGTYLKYNYFQLIEDFLVDEQYDWILLEYKNKNDLSESARKQLVKALVEFSVAFFEVSTLQKTHKVMAITAALQLLPNLSKPGQEDHFTVSKPHILHQF